MIDADLRVRVNRVKVGVGHAWAAARLEPHEGAVISVGRLPTRPEALRSHRLRVGFEPPAEDTHLERSSDVEPPP